MWTPDIQGVFGVGGWGRCLRLWDNHLRAKTKNSKRILYISMTVLSNSLNLYAAEQYQIRADTHIPLVPAGFQYWYSSIRMVSCHQTVALFSPFAPITPSLKLFKLWTMWSCKHTFSALGARSLIQVSCKACSAVYLSVWCGRGGFMGRFTSFVQSGTETLVKRMSEWLWHDNAVQMMTSWCRLLYPIVISRAWSRAQTSRAW